MGTCISNAVCRGLVMFNGFRSEVVVHFVDIGERVDHHCLPQRYNWNIVESVKVALNTIKPTIRELVVHHVNIGGIVDHHCLNLF